MTSEATERSDVEVAAAIRECVHVLNPLLREAVRHGLNVEIYLHESRSMSEPVGCRFAEARIQRVRNL